MIQHTNEFEKSVAAGTSYLDCFKGTDLRRTEIACGVWMIQNLCGSAFMGYVRIAMLACPAGAPPADPRFASPRQSTFFLQQAGVPVSASFSLSIGQYAIGAAGTVSSWFLMSKLGRRPLYWGGLVVLTVLLIVIGGMGSIPHSNVSAS